MGITSLSLSLLHLDMTKNCIGDMAELGITESYQVKRQVLLSAAEAAEMILRVDDILKAAPRCIAWGEGVVIILLSHGARSCPTIMTG